MDYNYTSDRLNRASTVENGSVSGYQANALNQYASVNGQGIGYDDNFNVISYNGVSFSYNAQNQLTGGSMQATYDGLGRCVRRTTGSGTRLYTYDDWNPIFEWDQWGNWLGWNAYGAHPDELLIRWDAVHGPMIYKQDQHGNVVALLDSGGNIVERYSYDAFGKPKVTGFWDDNDRGGSWYGNRFMFTGREYSPELGIYDYRNRFYLPALGRFIQPDPIGFKGDAGNLYRYCGNDPIDRSDPTGLLDTATAIWNMAKFFDSSSTFQGEYNQFMGYQPAGITMASVGRNENANAQFSKDITNLERRRGTNVGAEEVGKVLVEDGHAAAGDEAKALRLGHHYNSGNERAYARYVHGKALHRDGKQPAIGSNAFSGSEAGLPGYDGHGPVPLTGSHSHGPQQGPFGRRFQRLDEDSANGRFTKGVPYASSVGWYRDPGGMVNIYVPGGHYYHSSDGVNFFLGQLRY